MVEKLECEKGYRGKRQPIKYELFCKVCIFLNNVSVMNFLHIIEYHYQ